MSGPRLTAILSFLVLGMFLIPGLFLAGTLLPAGENRPVSGNSYAEVGDMEAENLNAIDTAAGANAGAGEPDSEEETISSGSEDMLHDGDERNDGDISAEDLPDAGIGQTAP